MVTLIDRVGFEVDAIDVFCGYGGSSQGIHAAGATLRAAANHSELSLECHAKNFPAVDHWQADLVDPVNPLVVNRRGDEVAGTYLDPADLPRARFAWFSPSCRHHSQANAKKVYEQGHQLTLLDDDEWDEEAYANSERSRVTMSCVLRYAAQNQPEIVVVENVLEVTKWGPGKNGATFRWWMTELRNLDYDIRCCFLNSMFFPPCPQSRDRIYVVAWRRGNRAPDLDYRPMAFCTSDRCGGQLVDAVQTWKRPTAAWRGLPEWGKYLDQYDYRCPVCAAVVHPASWMALSAIDWSNLGETLGGRKSLPAPNTMERIRRAIRKYWWAPPVLLPAGTPGLSSEVTVAHPASVSTAKTQSPARYAANRSRHPGEQLPTLAQRNTQGVATLAAGLPIRSDRPRSHRLDEHFASVHAGGGYGALALLVKNNGAIDEAGYRGHHLGAPFGAVTAHPTQTLVALVPNRTHNDARHAADGTAPVTTSATQGVVLAAAGNTSERPGQTRARHQTDPLFTQSTTSEFGFAALPVLRGDHGQESSPGEQVATVAASAGDTHGLVLLPWVDQWRSEPALITEQLAVVTTHLRHSLASIEPFEGEITDDLLMQVRFRMLQPDPELRRAMAFGDDYLLIGNKGQMTAGLGNAVTPPVASWITERCLATLSDDPDRMAGVA
jgi:DNA (cytosine-5)-methyltransferase 1